MLTGWGATSPSAALVEHPAMRRELLGAMDDLPDRGVLARGYGRSYGDAAQNAGGRVVDLTGIGEIDLDPIGGLVTATAGTSLDDIMRVIVPRGFFVPVTPGTRMVSVGGAIAADIHGKNHHRDGSFMDHVESLRLLIPSGEIRDVGPDRDPDLFWATAGGMGLTGIVVDATFRCPRIETSRLVVDTDRTTTFSVLLDTMRAEDDDPRYPYSVAWIDTLATGSSLGRGILTRGRFAHADELDDTDRQAPLAFDPKVLVTAPPVFPSGLLNKYTVRVLNELWFRKAPVRRRDELQTITTFFHPLDLAGSWNRAYGPAGFLQWQIALPDGAEELLHEIVERLSLARSASFVSVLKRFGPGNAGHLSFPIQGWTLTVDLPCGMRDAAGLLDRLDVAVADAGGRIYLAKDSRLRPDLLPTMYPRLDEWRDIRAGVDPHGALTSDLARRLGLLERTRFATGPRPR